MKRVNYDEVAPVYHRRYQSGVPAGIAEYLRELVFKVKAHRVLEVGFVFHINAILHFDVPSAFIYKARRIIRGGGALTIIGMDPHTKKDRMYLYHYFP
jgi:hypothetical protein